MGAFRTAVKFFTYSIRRPLGDIASSALNIKAAAKAAGEARAQLTADAKAARSYLAGKTPEEKFVEIYELNEWTELELADQARAAARTRIGMLVLCFCGLFLLGSFFWTLPFWAMAILGPVIVIFMAACCASAARYAWWTAQLKERRIYPLSDFVARKDFFRKVFWS